MRVCGKMRLPPTPPHLRARVHHQAIRYHSEELDSCLLRQDVAGALKASRFIALAQNAGGRVEEAVRTIDEALREYAVFTKVQKVEAVMLYSTKASFLNDVQEEEEEEEGEEEEEQQGQQVDEHEHDSKVRGTIMCSSCVGLLVLN